MNILWDFDGTLFDTYPLFFESFIKLIDGEFDEGEAYRYLKKDSKLAFRKFGIPESKRGQYIKTYNSFHSSSVKPFPYVESVLKSANMNVIVTHRDRDSVKRLLRFHHLEHYFSDIISVEEDGFQRKPNTESYEYVLKNYKINLVIGDRSLDLEPAKTLGVKTVSFQNDEIEADYQINGYDAFIAILIAESFDIQWRKELKEKVSPKLVGRYFGSDDKRLQHILEVTRKASGSPEALLHDIGYAKELIRTGFHPLDSALFALELGCEVSVIKTVLFHSFAANEAKLRGGFLKDVYENYKLFLTEEDEERIDFLTWCDMHTSSDGSTVDLDERLRDIYSRYEQSSVIYKNISEGEEYFRSLDGKWTMDDV
jgi:HAD superfamily hydrolase (TIGR01549 family)